MNAITEVENAVKALKYYCRRGQCVEVLRVAGLSEQAIKTGMARVKKHFPPGCLRARYVLPEFLEAFSLPRPGDQPKAV